jgi:metal-dependent amidase/aminoacylase/carboxypeptidase family protein
MIIDKKIISKVQELTKFYLDKIIKIRETIHANPELG